jgi:hypothetical protein
MDYGGPWCGPYRPVGWYHPATKRPPASGGRPFDPNAIPQGPLPDLALNENQRSRREAAFL